MYKCVASVLLFAFIVAGTSAETTCTQKIDAKLTGLLNEQIGVELAAQYSYLRLAHIFQQPNLYYPKMAEFFREKSIEEMTHAEDFMSYQTSRGAKYTPSAIQVNSEVASCGTIDSLYDGFKCAQDLEISVTKALTKLVSVVSGVTESTVVSGCSGSSQPAYCTYNKADYNEDLRSAQAALVRNGNADPIPMSGEAGGTSGCDDYTVEYIELAEHISHEYLGHQIQDTKILANVVQTLSKMEDERMGSFMVEKLLKLE